jgi:hypothetical protein
MGENARRRVSPTPAQPCLLAPQLGRTGRAGCCRTRGCVLLRNGGAEGMDRMPIWFDETGHPCTLLRPLHEKDHTWGCWYMGTCPPDPPCCLARCNVHARERRRGHISQRILNNAPTDVAGLSCIGILPGERGLAVPSGFWL